MKTKNALLRVLKNSSDVEATKWLYNVGLNIAKAYLQQRVSNGLLDLRYLHLDIDYVASTAVCELFSRDDENQFKVFSKCELLHTIENQDNIYSEIQFKRIVITKVRDTLFLMFKYNDLSLNKILRNVKSALVEAEYLKTDNFGNLIFNDTNLNQDLISSEVIDYLLFKSTKTTDSIPRIIELFEKELLNYGVGRLIIPLTDFCILIRSFTVERNIFVDGKDETSNYLNEKDLERIVISSLSKIETEYYIRYVESNKLSEDLYSIYMSSIKDMYITMLKNGDSAEESIMYYLKNYLPNLDSETYREKHRTFIEYLIRVSKKQIKNDYIIYF